MIEKKAMSSLEHITPESLDRLPRLDQLVRQGLYRGGLGEHVGTLRGTLGWQEMPHEIDLPDVPVTGLLPDWLSGTLLRTGPGKWDLGHQQLNHWWDGLALLQRFSFRGGRVSYRCQYLDSPAFVSQQRTGRLTWKAFATDPCSDLLRGQQTEFVAEPGNANINITRIGQAYVPIEEAPLAVTFDPETLRTTGWLDQVPDKDPVKGHHHVPAHPQRDFDRKTQYNVHTVLGAEPVYQVIATDFATGAKSVLSTVPAEAGNPGYRHHFSITDNYAVAMEYPLRLDSQALASGNGPFAAAYRWDPTAATKIFITDRADGTLVKLLETNGFFALHHTNAYEVGDAIIMDLAAYDNAEHIADYYLDRRRHGMPLSVGQLRRYTLPLGAGTQVHSEVVSSQQVELPTFDYRRYNTKPYRYVYAVGMRQDLPEVFYNQIVKADVQSRVSLSWFQDGAFPGEPNFVPTPDAVAEDDGVLLCLVLDTIQQSSFLLVLNAKDLSEIARAQLDTFVPYGLHGQFLGEHYSTL